MWSAVLTAVDCMVLLTRFARTFFNALPNAAIGLAAGELPRSAVLTAVDAVLTAVGCIVLRTRFARTFFKILPNAAIGLAAGELPWSEILTAVV